MCVCLNGVWICVFVNIYLDFIWRILKEYGEGDGCRGLFVCVCVMSWQHLRSYQDGSLLVTGHTHDDFYSAAPQGNQAVSTMT